MPKYELMYILASSVSDDQVPSIASQVKTIVSEFGGEDITENQLGKKKLAYPIKKTRNGFYVVVNFSMDSKKVNQLDAKIRTISSIIRYILVNLDEHLVRTEKDKVEQSKLSKRPENSEEETGSTIKLKEEPKVVPTEDKEVETPAVEITTEELDKKIEEALTEDLLK